MGKTAGLLLVLVLIAAGAAAAVVVIREPAPPIPEVRPEADPIDTVVATRSYDIRVAATIKPTWERERSIKSPAMAGTVTALFVPGGTEITGGQRLFSVDEVVRHAYDSRTPPYRALELGATGSDVADLQRFLDDLGYNAGEADGRFGGQTEAALEAFQADAGMRRPTGVFVPADVVWFNPTELPFVAGVVNIEVGAEAPKRGDELFRTPRTLHSAEVVPDEQIPQFVADRDLQVQIDDLVFVVASLEPRLEPSEDLQQAFLALVEAGADNDVELGGVITLAEPIEALTVPNTAIVTDSSGERVCVIRADGQSVQVELLSVSLDSTLVLALTGAPQDGLVARGTLDPGDLIRANPQDRVAGC